ncbi:MAG: RluA family pseudouridine synthase [Candidatus Omnitrophica bacterium]|nr:RluA family pseudouridine synthase [Candidatus Omnitrophota bacterium]
MIPVIYEDQWLLILDKPEGLLVIPTPKAETHTLTGILNERLKKDNIPYRLHPCHRLDRDTSGLIIYAKGKSIQKKMMDGFRDKKIKKKYIAFVQGCPRISDGQITDRIEGRPAVTKYRILECRDDFSVVEASPVTGRTNQIRLHFKQLGNPILGDTRFVFRRHFKVKAKRLCLHAKSLEFIHPITGEKIFAESELPDKMCQMLERRQ